jgi:exopolysaccharide production protein ExoQ
MVDTQQQPDEQPDLWRKLEALACGFVLFMLSNAFIGPLLDPLQAGGENIPVLRLMWLPVYALILGLAAWRAPRLMRFWFPAVMLSLLIFWVFASASWSLDPGTTNRRALAAAFTTLFGLYFASSFDGRRMAEIIATTFLFLADRPASWPRSPIRRWACSTTSTPATGAASGTRRTRWAR